MFPCNKIIDPGSGLTRYHPIHCLRQLAFFLMIGLPIFLIAHVTLALLFLLTGKSHEEMFECLRETNPVLGETFLDGLVLFALLTFMWVTFFVVQWGNYSVKKELCQLANLDKFYRLNRSDIKIIKPFTIQVVLVCIFAIFQPTMNRKMMEACAPSLPSSVLTLLCIPFFFTVLLSMIPLLVFHGITMEVTVALIEECEQLSQKDHASLSLCRHYQNLLDRIKLSRKVLSPNNFFVTTLLSVQILTISFILLYHLADNWKNLNDFIITTLSANVVFLIMIGSLLWFMNIWSEKATNKIHELTRHFKNIYISNDVLEMIEFEGQFVPPLFMKARLEEELDEFRGFDGKGYFILGKSFLKNLLAFCVTYLVILIQFRLTEDPPATAVLDPDPVLQQKNSTT